MATNPEFKAASVERFAGSGYAAASAAGTTNAHVAPGDSVTYKLRIDRRRADQARKLVHGSQLQLGVEVQFERIETRLDGVNWYIGVGDRIRTENKLAWPPE